MTPQAERAAAFLALHEAPEPLLLPNPWDVGSAKILASLGFHALATTSSGFAASVGQRDGALGRDEALLHCEMLVSAVDLPISADLEHGFADQPDGVAETIRLAVGTGLAGGSIEDYAGRAADRIYDRALAAERVTAAAEAAHGGDVHFVLTARAENHIRGVSDLDDTIARLQSYQEAGADVLYAPGLTTIEEIDAVVRSVDRPVNVLVLPGGPKVGELARLGVRRISVGGAFAYVAIAALTAAARELRESGTLGFMSQVIDGAVLAHEVLG